MKRLGLIILFLVIGVAMVSFSACSKKKVAPTTQELSAEEKARLEAEKKKAEEARLREQRMREEQLRLQREKELRAQFENEDIHFDFDKSFIRPDAEEILQRKAAWLKEHPNAKILIEGHCDERGTDAYNLALGERRALSAKKYLESLGIDPSRISIISYGEERPIDPRHNEEAWAKNRRAHFVIVSE